MNLLTDDVFALPDGSKASLAGVFAAMSAGTVAAFPALRPHQRPAWHMFLVQLGALALQHADRAELSTDLASWREALRNLSQTTPTMRRGVWSWRSATDPGSCSARPRRP